LGLAVSNRNIDMKKFKKERHNPLELIKSFWPKANVDHIIYDPNLKVGDFNVVRQSGGDGTLSFTLEMLQKGLIGIARMEVCCISNEPSEPSKVKGIKYTVGSMKHATVYGMINLKCNPDRKFPGQRERISMPVKCEYIYF
jgi:hypothetical protein